MPPTITSTIIKVDVTVTEAPAPSGLQQSGAIISLGATTLAQNTSQYCGTDAAVLALLTPAGNHIEVMDMAQSFFAQGNAVGVSVLELGTQISGPAGITALDAWIDANPDVFYAFLVPATWDASGSTLNTMAANFSSPTGKTYFFVTTTSGTISAYQPTTKAIFATVPSPTAAASEFQSAFPFYQLLSNNPGIASPAAPMAYRFGFGVTPWVTTNNQTTITNILSVFGNVILTGAEGGISTATLFKGTTMDGNQMMAWYAIDWLQIQSKLDLANAVINGSNENPPLYYNQTGINRLIAILTGLGSDGISFGLLQSADFEATPFTVYVKANPSDYQAGIYNGFSATVTAQLGFLTIEFKIDATQFAT